MDTITWQSQFANISSILVHLMNSKILYDVILVVGNTSNERRIKSHKLLLSIRSDVFEKMFYDPVSIAKKEIAIPDANPDIFEIMLKYIYTETLMADSLEDIIQTYYLAARYNITQLMQMCRMRIESELCQANVCSVYEMTLILNFQNLRSKCENIICKYTEEVLESESFLKCSYKTIQNIITLNFLNIKKELFLFEKVLQWAKISINKEEKGSSFKNLRKFIDPLLPHIRFLSMSHEDIFRGLARSGIFSQEEVMSIGMNIPEPADIFLPRWCNENRNERKCYFAETSDDFPETNEELVSSTNSTIITNEDSSRVRSRIGSTENVSYSVLKVHHDCSAGKLSNPKHVDGMFCIESMISCDKEVMLNGFSFYIKYRSPCNAELYIADGRNPCRLIQCAENINQKSTYTINYNHQIIIVQPITMKRNLDYYVKVFTDDEVGSCTKSFPTSSTLKTIGVKFNIRYINVRNNSHFHELYFAPLT